MIDLERMRRDAAIGLAAAALLLGVIGGAAAQSPGSDQPGTVETAPGTSAGARTTLVPDPGDPADVDEVTLTAKPVAILSGSSDWESGFTSLKNAYRRIEVELAKAGVKPTGRPVTLFTQTDDDGFRYDAMIPIERPPEGSASLGPDIRFGTTPAGRAYRFVHKGPYDDIESTYETITAYVDAKDISVQDAFMEEYVGDLAESSQEIEVNIFALEK